MAAMDSFSPEQLLLLPLWYVSFLLAVTCHEAAHAWVAHLGGDSTAYQGGQVSLNPLPHMQREPFGTILVPVISFVLMGWTIGWASAPYDPHWEIRYPRRAALMALAGPLANLLLAAIFFTLLKVGLSAGWWIDVPALRAYDQLVVVPDGGASWLPGLSRFASISLLLNSVLFIFNLLPVPPLDGSSVLAGISRLGRQLRELLQTSFSFFGLIIAWVVFPYLFQPFFALVISWLY